MCSLDRGVAGVGFGMCFKAGDREAEDHARMMAVVNKLKED